LKTIWCHNKKESHFHTLPNALGDNILKNMEKQTIMMNQPNTLTTRRSFLTQTAAASAAIAASPFAVHAQDK